MLTSTLLEATKAGAAEILRFFNGDFKISNKEGVNNLVTEADHASEKAIFEVILYAFSTIARHQNKLTDARIPQGHQNVL